MNKLVKYFSALFLTISLILTSCSSNEEGFQDNENQIFRNEVTIHIGQQKSAITGNITLKWEENSDNPYDYTITENLLKAAGLTLAEFDQLLVEQEMLVVKSGDTDLPPENHAGCIEWCKNKYTDDNGDKIRGRGACKANCWVQTAVRILEAAAELVPA